MCNAHPSKSDQREEQPATHIKNLSLVFSPVSKKNPNRFNVALLQGEFQRNAAFRTVPFASSRSEVSFFGFVVFSRWESRGGKEIWEGVWLHWVQLSWATVWWIGAFFYAAEQCGFEFVNLFHLFAIVSS